MAEPLPRRMPHPLELAAWTVVTLAGLKAAAGLVNPILLAALLALICVPPMRWLQKRGLPELLSVVLSVVGLLCISLGVTAVIGSSVSQFNESLPEYQQSLDAFVQERIAWLEARDIRLPIREQIASSLDSGRILSLVGDTMSGLVSLLSNLFVIGLLVIFMLLEASGLPRKLRRAHGGQAADLSQYRRVMHNVSEYVAVKTFVSLLTGLAIGLSMWALGVGYAVLWGVIAFAFNYVPNIGSLIAAIPGVLFALVDVSPGRAVLVAIAYLAVNFLLGNLLEPRLMGKRLGLSTLVVFLSLLVWAWVLGPVGMLVAAPLTAILKIALENSPDLRPLAVLLGPPDEADPGAAPHA